MHFEICFVGLHTGYFMMKNAETGWIGPIIAKGFCGLWLATKGIFMENVMLLKVSNKMRAVRKIFFGYR